MDPHAVACADPACVALSGVRDSALGVGDRVLVTGLGAIGQMALQLARLQQGRLRVEGLLDPVVRLADSADAYRQIDANPAASVKLGVTYR